MSPEDVIGEVDDDLDLDDLEAVARRIAARPELWEGDLPDDLAGRPYAEVHTSEHLGIWAIGWGDAEDDTGFHDHDRSRGAVAVARGGIRHELLQPDGTGRGRVVPAGESYQFDETAIHRMAWDPEGGATVTIHAYSPPLERTGQYTVDDHDHPLRRMPTSSEEALSPKTAREARVHGQ